MDESKTDLGIEKDFSIAVTSLSFPSPPDRSGWSISGGDGMILTVTLTLVVPDGLTLPLLVVGGNKRWLGDLGPQSPSPAPVPSSSSIVYVPIPIPAPAVVVRVVRGGRIPTPRTKQSAVRPFPQ